MYNKLVVKSFSLPMNINKSRRLNPWIGNIRFRGGKWQPIPIFLSENSQGYEPGTLQSITCRRAHKTEVNLKDFEYSTTHSTLNIEDE